MSFWQKLYTGDKSQLVNDIRQKYQKQGFLMINFLYFATIIATKLDKTEKEDKFKIYQNAIEECDFLLPDGIALKLVYLKHFGKSLQNLNGTDFLPYFFDNFKDREINVILYGTFKERIQKAKEGFEAKFPTVSVSHFQDGYSELQWENLNIDKNKLNIVLVGRGSPRQEIWAYQNMDKLKENGLIVFNVGGLLDFWAGLEKRAPKIFIRLKGERVWRFLTKPKKNAKKFFQSFVFLYFLLKKNI